MTQAPSDRSALDAGDGRSTPLPLIFAAWLVVVLPAGWGIWQTARQSTALFSTASAPTDQRTLRAPIRSL